MPNFWEHVAGAGIIALIIENLILWFVFGMALVDLICITISIVWFFFYTIYPDIDHKKSRIRQTDVLHLLDIFKVKHRGWYHTVYAALLLPSYWLGMWVTCYILFSVNNTWLLIFYGVSVLGYMIHLILDWTQTYIKRRT